MPPHPLPAFDDNYIWLLGQPASGNALVVDPGDAAPVLAAFPPGTSPAAISRSAVTPGLFCVFTLGVWPWCSMRARYVAASTN